MLAAVRQAVSSNAGSASRGALLQLTRAMSEGMRGVRGFSEHEIAVENRYFNKEDERLLAKLLNKVKAHTEEEEASAAAHASEVAALRQILGKYKVSKEDFDAVIAWKHSHF